MIASLRSPKRPEVAYRYETLVSDSATPCGVEAFARRLADNLGEGSTTRVLSQRTVSERPAAEARSALIVNLPIVAWKRRLADPIVAAAKARLARDRVVVVLHEWCDLDWKRRVSYLPLLVLADVVMFSSPLIATAFGRSAASAVTTPTRGILPIPPNVSMPAVLRDGPFSKRMVGIRAENRVILGHFGSIYPRKRSAFVLDVAAEMKARGERPFMVFAGSFIQGQDAVEEEFYAHVRRLGLEDDVLVTGFIADEAELFGLLTHVDVFVYSFAEGLSTRRASVFACLTANKPVVVNAPREMSEFEHHPAYKTLLETGLLRLVSLEAGAVEVADAVEAARDAVPAPGSVGVEAAWASATRHFVAILSGQSVAAPPGASRTVSPASGAPFRDRAGRLVRTLGS